ncbi:hypothetical protein GYMLUDRAFT_234345 [Collybiopsis luxurians FD-317 M1]|uniref:Purine nucleoside permease n=1 Tax=Collybiopsis luxurians FD-317 M1 TaxID=944289 RepID=A0A0D0C8M6_9AGAR|nr:hypothetical protein GYMLUDRAFT_234345 [Collybiopsis luxurians FD-317 M1]
MLLQHLLAFLAPSLQILYVVVFGSYLDLVTPAAGQPVTTSSKCTSNGPLQPKVFIIDMFEDEGDVWYNVPEFNLLACNITVPGFSPKFPDAHCTQDGSICQVVTGEAEINAASTISALVYSNIFNLKTTYFFIAGIAGVNPKVATIGDVTFAQYAVQVALQYEFDAREMPEDFPTGYVPQGSTAPGQYPQSIYGTEVFQLNSQLMNRAVGFAKNATLQDSTAAQQLRAIYAQDPAFHASSSTGPSIVTCDTATSDVYFTGDLLGEAFENTTTLFTNGQAVYCTTQQEDNGTLEALLRTTLAGLTDFSRVILMRTASDFDRPHQGQTAADNLFGDTPGFEPAVKNIYLAGVKVVEGIVNGWNESFEAGIKPTGYIGDILGSLGGTPGFRPGSASKRRSYPLSKRV